MKKTDLVLIAAVILLAAAIILVKNIISNRDSNPLFVQVVIGQEVVDELPLDMPLVKTYETEDGINILVIENGECYIREADCYNQVCVNTGHKSSVGDSIVCMPHKLAATIVSGR